MILLCRYFCPSRNDNLPEQHQLYIFIAHIQFCSFPDKKESYHTITKELKATERLLNSCNFEYLATTAPSVLIKANANKRKKGWEM